MDGRGNRKGRENVDMNKLSDGLYIETRRLSKFTTLLQKIVAGKSFEIPIRSSPVETDSHCTRLWNHIQCANYNPLA